jgi:hypothetical protein
MKTHITVLLFFVLYISVRAANNEETRFSEVKSKDSALGAKQTVGILFSTNSLDNVVLYPVGPHGVYGQEVCKDAVITYGVELSEATVRFLDDAEGEHDLESRLARLVEIRNKLMRAGGYANSSLAGSLTSVLHAHFWDLLNQGKPISKRLLHKNRVSRSDVLKLVAESGGKEKKNVCFSSDVLDKSNRNDELVLSLLGQSKSTVVPVRGLPPDVWRQREPEGFRGMGFRTQYLEDANSSSHVYNWFLLIDEQYAIEIVDAEVVKDPAFPDLDMDEAKMRIDASLNISPHEKKISNLRTWNGREVYNYFRKFRYGSLFGASPLETRVRLILESR